MGGNIGVSCSADMPVAPVESHILSWKDHLNAIIHSEITGMYGCPHEGLTDCLIQIRTEMENYIRANTARTYNPL